MNANLQLLLYVCAVTVAVFWVAAPLIKRRSSRSQDMANQEQIQSLQRALKTLRERKSRYSEDDFANIERRLKLSLAKIYARSEQPATAAQEQDQETCAGCGAPKAEGHRFCTHCGNALSADAA